VGTVVWDEEMAEVFDTVFSDQFDPAVLDPMAAGLAELAGDGAALEFGVGTGRVALALSARGVLVRGIELSPHMAARLERKPGAEAVDVVVGDMCTATVAGPFRLVYLVANTIMNVTTQDEQVAVFANAAAHLEPGGCFALEIVVPGIRGVAPGAPGRVFALEPDHAGIDTFDDVLGQVSWSLHWYQVDGRWLHHAAPFRYVWPSELDLMARIAGLRLAHRWADWRRQPFDAESRSQVVVYEKPRA